MDAPKVLVNKCKILPLPLALTQEIIRRNIVTYSSKRNCFNLCINENSK